MGMSLVGADKKPSMLVYGDLLNEARMRVLVLKDLLDATPNWPNRVLQEFCFLQLRILCEQIALGCVIAHDDITHPEALKQWHVDKIFRRLGELKPQFYPKALDGQFGDGHHHFTDATRPCLTKSELVQLWTLCGSHLHRGTAKALLSEAGNMPFDRAAIIEYAQKIANLLQLHAIQALSGKDVWIASWSWEPDGSAMMWSASSPG